MFSLVAAVAIAAHTAFLPDAKLTPGKTSDITTEQLCSKQFHTETVRNVTAAMKRKVYQLYGVHCTVSGRPIAGVPLFAPQVRSMFAGSSTSDTKACPIAASSARVGDSELMITGAEATSRFNSAGASPTKYVFTMGNGFQVLGVHTAGISTDMIKLIPSLDPTLMHDLPTKDVRPINFTSEKAASVIPSFQKRSCPRPATSLVDVNVTPKRVVKRLKSSAHASGSSLSLPACKDAYEVDHLIPLELGGANDLTNLWPQPRTTDKFNAWVKDVLENKTHKLVCTGKMTLQDAQLAMSSDWVELYNNVMSTSEKLYARKFELKKRAKPNKTRLLRRMGKKRRGHHSRLFETSAGVARSSRARKPHTP